MDAQQKGLKVKGQVSGIGGFFSSLFFIIICIEPKPKHATWILPLPSAELLVLLQRDSKEMRCVVHMLSSPRVFHVRENNYQEVLDVSSAKQSVAASLTINFRTYKR